VRTVEGAMAALSAVLLPLGLVLIVLGWYGASHSSYLFEQVPYLISGGLVGLGMVTAGGLVYFGSWIARGAAQQQRQSEEVAGLLREIRDELQARPASRAPAPSRRTSSNGSPFVATQRGSMLHRQDCAVVAGRDDLRKIGADGGGLRPCALCDPLSADASTTAS
jgi:hypothetical protein